MKRKRSLSLIIFSITAIYCFTQNGILYALNESTTRKNRVAVLEISTNNISPSYGNIARNSFEVFLFNSGNFQLLDRERQKSVAVKLGISPDSNNSIEDLQKFGKNLSADYLISGNIDKIEDFKITLRAVSVSSGEIITACTQSFSSIDEFDAVLNIVSGTIKDNLNEYSRDGKIKKSSAGKSHIFSAGINFDYFIPVSDFHNLISSGPGTDIRGDLSGIFFENAYAGLHASYYRFDGKKNTDDYARFIMLQLAYGYKFNPYKTLYLKTEVESGINMITLNHTAGTGFYMDDNSRDKAIDPVVQFGLSAGVNPISLINIETGARCGIDFESGGNLYFFNLSIGLSAAF